jgi:nucleoside-diphosphate-sugar epimerase
MSNSTMDDLVGRRVLVAGAGGFLGRHLVGRLAHTGAEVFALSRRVPSTTEGGVRWLQADLAELALAKSAFKEIRPDIVYQLCGHPNGGRDLSLVLPTLKSDLLTTVNLLLVAAENPLKCFVTTASLEEPEHGESPTCPYAAAKMANGAYARMFHLLYQVPAVILRPFMTYGPEQPDTKVISYIIKALIKGDSPQLSSGDRLVDWIYIDDVIDGFLAAATAIGAEGHTIDLGTGHLVSIRDVANKLTRLTHSIGHPVFGALQDRPFERIRRADSSAAQVRLGWQAKVSLDDGLQMTVDWWRKHLAADALSPRRPEASPVLIIP